MIRPLAAALVLALAACGHDVPEPPVDEFPGAPTTSAHPDAGAYATVQYVTIVASEPATIYYTTDGTDPDPGAAGTESGRNPVFWIRVGEGTTTLRFFSVDDVGNRGPAAEAAYVVELPP
jgi:hypothetical protein